MVGLDSNFGGGERFCDSRASCCNGSHDWFEVYVDGGLWVSNAKGVGYGGSLRDVDLSQ